MSAADKLSFIELLIGGDSIVDVIETWLLFGESVEKWLEIKGFCV